MSDLLADLTPAQREAVSHYEGPLLVVAGAGSGKTRVVTRRVAHLIQERRVAPREVLAITFTNKAAREMAERIEDLTQPGGSATRGGRRSAVWVSTFHSFCARLLRRYGTWVGYTRDFTILDDGDQRMLMREALVESGTDPKLLAPPKALYGVERLKDQLLQPPAALDRAESLHEERVAKAYELYQRALRDSNAMDFSDLLMQAVLLLRQDEVREQLERRFRFVLIDEYQDTNHSQYQLARLLSRAHGNLCATGDPDQSIYGWRGADVQNILRFEREFPGAKVVRLEQNFRSTQLILDAANGLIAHNTDRHEKTLQSDEGEGEPVQYLLCEGEFEEARAVAQRIKSLVRGGTNPDEIAVLYRVGALSRALETALRERGIDHRVVGSVAFYQRREVKDMLAFLRLVQNPADEVALRRVINVPPRHVGKTSLEKIAARARADGCSMSDAAEALAEGGAIRSKRTRAGLKQFLAILAKLRQRAALGVRLEDLVRDVLAETKYRDYVIDSAAHTSEEQDRLSNLEALCAAAHEFDKQWGGGPLLLEDEEPLVAGSAAPKEPEPSEPEPAEEAMPLFAAFAPPEPEPAPEPSAAGPASAEGLESDERQGGIAAFLEHTALVNAAEEEEERRDVPKVSLMTIHAAKGLEFEVVYLIGLEEGLFPHGRALEDGSGGLEEERRLAYVALTRAKRKLTLSRARYRRYQGQTKPRELSLFVFELPAEAFPAGRAPLELERGHAVGRVTRADEDDYLGIDEPADPEAYAAGGGGPQPRWSRGLSGQRARKSQPSRSKRNNEVEEIRKLAAAIADQSGGEDVEFRAGDRVYHEHFGRGVVLALRGRRMSRKVEVDFESYGTKALVLQYARMRKLGEDEP